MFVLDLFLCGLQKIKFKPLNQLILIPNMEIIWSVIAKCDHLTSDFLYVSSRWWLFCCFHILQWASASNFLLKHQDPKNPMTLAPPQIFELGRILNFTDAESLKEFSWGRSKMRVELLLPIVCTCEDAVLILYPGRCDMRFSINMPISNFLRCLFDLF